MKKEDRVAWESKKAPGWNIWLVKNRWLRMAITWPLLAATIVAVLLVTLVALPLFAVRGAWHGLRDTLNLYDQEWWSDVRRYAWAALSGKDEPA